LEAKGLDLKGRKALAVPCDVKKEKRRMGLKQKNQNPPVKAGLNFLNAKS